MHGAVTPEGAEWLTSMVQIHPGPPHTFKKGIDVRTLLFGLISVAMTVYVLIRLFLTGKDEQKNSQNPPLPPNLDNMTYGQMAAWLTSRGCTPCTSYKGKAGWRTHVNACGNFWEDAPTVAEAMRKAIIAWDKAGRPLDGTAVCK